MASPNNNGEDGKNFIWVGEKTKKLKIFLNINKFGEAQITAGRIEKFRITYKQVYSSI